MKGDGATAKRKLRETEFFLKKLKAEGSSGSAGETFSFYLSAFLSALKSTIEITRKEMTSSAVDKWLAKLPTMDQEYLSFLIDQRNKEIHLRGARIETASRRRSRVLVPTVQPLSYSDLADSSETVFGPIDQKSGLPLYIEVAREEVVHVLRIKSKRHVAIAVCARAVELLRTLLSVPR